MSELGITIWMTSLLVFTAIGACLALYFERKNKN